MSANTRIILIRHGQTDWNLAHKFQGGSDIPLNDTGRAQVAEAIDSLKALEAEGVHVDGVVSSPLIRAVESGQIIARGLDVPFMGTYEGLQERSFGDLEGREATQELIAQARAGLNTTVEPREAFITRTLAAINRIRNEHEGKTIVVAAHGMLISMVMGELYRNTPEQLMDDPFVPGVLIYPIPRNAELVHVPLELLDDAIDRVVVRANEPELDAEEVPEGALDGSLTLIRHGQTTWNKAELMQGTTNIPLNDTGRAQAYDTGAVLAARGLHFDVLISSPLIRAAETARIVGERFDLSIGATDAELVERYYGSAEGLRIPDTQLCSPERYWPGVESEHDVYIRGVRALRRIVRQHPGAHIMVVSHGSFIRRTYSAALGREHRPAIPNAEPIAFDIAGLFAWSSREWFGADLHAQAAAHADERVQGVRVD